MTVLKTGSQPIGEWIPGFTEQAFAACAGHGNGVVRRKREEAFARYAALPAPHAMDEEWRKTDPSMFAMSGLKPLPKATVGGGATDDPWADAFDIVVNVQDTQISVQDPAGLAGRGSVVVCTLDEAARSFSDCLDARLHSTAPAAGADKFTALNGAFWNVGLFVRIAPGVRLERGLLVRFRQTANDALLVPRMLVVAEEGSEATVVEHLVSGDETRMGVISAKELFVAAAARLRFLTLQEWGRRTFQIGNDMAVVQRDAQIDWITLNLGSRVSKLKFGSDVAGPGSAAELDGIFFTDQDQHIDQTTLQIHSSPDTYSRLLYKGAVTDQGHSIYRGIIQAKPGAIKVDAYQTNNNLVLSDGAIADTIPGLLIDADDLKCSHGATIGNLDQDQVFYLRARGIPEHEARKLLILGFYDEILDRIPYAALRDRVHAVLTEKLDRVVLG